MISELQERQNSQQIVVREAVLKDMKAIHELEQMCFDMPWSLESLYEDICENPNTCYLVVEQDGEIVAYGGMWIIIDEAHITNICVHENYRRMGYGTLLMEQLFCWAKKRGAEKMTLEVRVSNEGALKLYGNIGFTVAGVRKKYYANNGEDAFVMWKQGL